MYTEMMYSNSLYHHGIKGQHWGERRYQNEDGTLTAAGKERYYKTEYKPAKEEYKQAKKEYKKARKNYDKAFDKAQKYEDRKYNQIDVDEKVTAKNNKNWKIAERAEERYSEAIDRYESTKDDYKTKQKQVWDNVDKKKLAIGLGVAAATVATVYVMSNPERRKAAKEIIKNTEKSTVKSLKQTSKNAGKAAMEAAFAAAGTIAATKVAKKLEAKSDASEAEKNVRKIATDAATAAINTAAKTNKSNNSNNSNGHLGKDISEKIGPPNKPSQPANQHSEWAKLMGEIKDPNMKATAKAMSQNGYDIDQIKAYLYGGSISHDSQGRVTSQTGTINIKHSATRGYYAIIKFS